MTIKEGIKQALRDNRRTQTWLAEKMGYARASSVNNMLARGNVKFETLYRVCEELDYEITIQPKHRAGRRPEGQIVLEVEE